MRQLDRIWVRVGLAMALTMLVTLAVQSASLALFWEWDYQRFYQSLPADTRERFDALVASGQGEGPQAMQIYLAYWPGDPIRGDALALLTAMVVGLLFGLGASFMVSRRITKPLSSMAESASRVALGDFSVRAHAGGARGELADMLQDFNHMIDALAELDAERRQTMASLSHELRTPLAVLSARLYAIRDGVIPGSATEIQGLLEQSLHLGRLVEDMHTLVMAKGGQLTLRCEVLDLAALARQTLARFDARLQAQGIARSETWPAGPVWVQADPDRVRQIIANLLENVLRHAASGRWLGVSVAAAQGQVWLEVADAGPGLPPARQAQPFARPGTGAGAGLGLSIVQALAQRQGGHAEALCSTRGGLCVRLVLPEAALEVSQG